MSDQQRADSIGPGRHPCADYPNMEQLRGESVSFDNFCASAIPCVPSREVMLTGRQEWMSRGNGNAKFNTGDDRTWMSVLRDHGYGCVSVGKTHMIHAGSTHIQVPLKNSFGDQGGWDHFHPAASPEPEESYFDIHTATRAREALRSLAGDEAPFALFVGFHAPHEPYIMPERYLDFVDPKDAPLPAVRADHEHDQKSKGYRNRVEHFKRLFGGIDDQKTRLGVAGHHCLLKMVDDCLGAVREEIESLDLLEETLFVYCSDHGDLLGEHWLFNKAATFYESEIRIPMMIRFPNGAHAGSTVSGLASGIDVFPTLLDGLGIGADVSLPGMSLLPAILDGAATREYVTCTNTGGMMIRTDSKKLWYSVVNDDGEMYDLEADPQELNNLYNNPEASAMRHELFEQLLRSRMNDDLAYSRPTERDKLIHREMRTLHEPEI